MTHKTKATEGKCKYLTSIYIDTDKEKITIENTLTVFESLQQSNTFIPVSKKTLEKYILAAMVEQQRQNRGE